MDWLKLNSKGILRGSLARSNNVTQLIWIKLLAMASETRDRDGYLRYKKGEPYSLDFIAQICNVSRNDLDIALDDFMDDIRDGIPRVEFAEDGSLRLNNWTYYQTRPVEEEASPRLRKAISDEVKDNLTIERVNKKPELGVVGLSQHISGNTGRQINEELERGIFPRKPVAPQSNFGEGEE